MKRLKKYFTMSIIHSSEPFSGRSLYKKVEDPSIEYTRSKTKTFNLIFEEKPYQKSYPFSRKMYMEPRLLTFHWEKLHYVVIYEWKRLLEEYKEKTHQINMYIHIQNLCISLQWYYGNESCSFCAFSNEDEYSGLPKIEWKSTNYIGSSVCHKKFLDIFKTMTETHYNTYYKGNIYTSGLKF